MKPEELYNFLYFMVHNKNLTREQKKLRDRLLLNGIPSIPKTSRKNRAETFPNLTKHKPKDTADFLSLFEDPNGLKFLTHNFDPDSENVYEGMLDSVSKICDREFKTKNLPNSLMALCKTAIDGPSEKHKTWIDYLGNSHTEYFKSEQWRTICGKRHPINFSDLKEAVESFRRSVRLVKPGLQTMVETLSQKYSNLKIECKDLEKADFFTYTFRLQSAIDKILADMSQHNAWPNVVIKFKRDNSRSDYFLRIIEIEQLGSEASDVDEALRKFHSRGGAFKGIADLLYGYCNWSVEAIWNGAPYLVNLLNDENKTEKQSLNYSPTGFKHILTFYRK